VRLIIADPRRIDLVRTPHVEADYHLKAAPRTNVARSTRAYAVDRGLGHEDLRAHAANRKRFVNGASLASEPRTPEG
jgi:formate dehydrogenase major subunit